MTTPRILTTIRDLTAALIAQDAASVDTATARKAMIRQAVADGHTYTAIAQKSGITRQRVAQLATEGGE